MYDIYIKNYYDENRKMVLTEKKLYNIPISRSYKDNVLTDPSVTVEMGKAGSFEFTVNPTHPYYHSFAQMKTIMRVEYDGDTIFRGRVLTIDNTLSGTKRIHCEGDLAFLLDSIQESTKEADRSSVTLNAYIKSILSNHNSQVRDISADEKKEVDPEDKVINAGWIPNGYPDSIGNSQKIDNTSDKYGSGSREQSMNALETLGKRYGGYFRTRYVNGKCYFDWMRNWFRRDLSNSQPISVTQNMIDTQTNAEVDNIFTALIPIGSSEGKEVTIEGYKENIHGKNKRILVPQLTKVYSADELSRGFSSKDLFANAIKQFGIIYKTQNFSNADTQEKLWEYACDWIKNNYIGGTVSFDLTAVDMHHIDNTVVKYLVGDVVHLRLPTDILPEEDQKDGRYTTINRTIISIKYDLHHPEKNSYNLGVPNDILSKEYGTKSTSKSTSGKGGKASGGGGPKEPPPPGDNDKEKLEALHSTAWEMVWNASFNNSQYKRLKRRHGEGSLSQQLYIKPALNVSEMAIYKVISGEKTADEMRSIILNGHKQRVQIRDMSQVEYFIKFHHIKPSNALKNPLDEALDAADSIVLSALSSNKSLGLKGNSSTSMNALMGGLKNLNIPENATEEEVASMIKPITDNIPMPNTVAEMKTTVSETLGGSKEAGVVRVSQEDQLTGQMTGDGNGKIDCGKTSDNHWLIRMNHPVTYVEDGVTKTVPDGTIKAADFCTVNYPSISAQLGVFKDLIAERATIEQLRVERARIDTLEATQITASTVTSILANATSIGTASLTVTTNLKFGTHDAYWVYSESDGRYYLGRRS